VNYFDIAFAFLLANNLLFFHFLGLGELLGDPTKGTTLRRTLGLGALLLVTVSLFWIPDHFLLRPFHLEFLRTLVLLAAVGAGYLLTAAAHRLVPGPWPQPKEILVHSLLIGATVLIGTAFDEWTQAALACLAAAAGYGAALVLLRSVFSRLARERIPAFLQGLPLQLLTLGLVWLVLHGLGFAFAGKGA